MPKPIKNKYRLESGHTVISFYKFLDLIKYIKLYPRSRIIRKRDKSSSVIYRDNAVYLFNFSKYQSKVLRDLFKERVIEFKYDSYSKYQHRVLVKKFVVKFNLLNYFQQVALIKSRANSRRRSDSAFSGNLHSTETYIEEYTNYLKTLKGLIIKPNPIV